MAYRLGVDIGGTFTDFALLNASAGRLTHYKVPTTPADPAEGVVLGLSDLLEQCEVDPRDIEYFVHGTTLGLNTVIQRSGANLAFFTTEGFRDLLEVQRMRLADPLNFASKRPAPLIPRWHVFEIRERILADGSLDVQLDPQSVARAVQAVTSLGLDGVVVCLLNAHRNALHEQAVRAIAREIAPDLYMCCSHEVWPQIREYERAIVAVINAYIRPKLAGYLDSLTRRLSEMGVHVQPYITRSNGGVMTAQSAYQTPVQTLLSGPASGVIGAMQAARTAGLRDVLTLDMSGTSADIAVVRDGEAQYSRDEHVSDFPVIMPSVGVSSIGAGGGSVAWIDRSGLLKVGPSSAGAEPGPACYGRGGTAPTLTDAFLVSGFIDPDNFLGGRIRLQTELAHSVIGPIAERLNISVEAAAEGIIQVSTANMYAEFSQVMARNGLDPRDFTLVAFGGAGPIQACFLADEFHIPRVLIPASPGTLCAVGALSADIRSDYVRTVGTRVTDGPLERLRPVVDALRRQAEEWLSGEGPSGLEQRLTHTADMRYGHQAYEIEVPLDLDWLDQNDTEALLRAFHSLHQQLYGHADPEEPVEIISLHVKAVADTPKPPSRKLASALEPTRTTGERTIRIRGQRHQAKTYVRDDLLAGDAFTGPAVVDEDGSTVLVPVGFKAQVDANGNLVITHPVVD
jgi:N-methylhydantoinase A